MDTIELTEEMVYCGPTAKHGGELTKATELLAEKNAAPSIRYRIARMKKYCRAIWNACDFIGRSICWRVDSDAFVDPRRDAGYVPLVALPGGLERCVGRQAVNNKNPNLRVLQGGKSNQFKHNRGTPWID